MINYTVFSVLGVFVWDFMECNIGKDSMDHIHVNVLEGIYFVKLGFQTTSRLFR